MNSIIRANTSASTALSALIWVDRIFISFRDSSNRTLVDTCTTSYTVVINYVSHFCFLFKLLLIQRDKCNLFLCDKKIFFLYFELIYIASILTKATQYRSFLLILYRNNDISIKYAT